MNIIFFQNQFCTIALKQAIALKSNVNRLVGITSSKNATSIVHQNLIKNTFNKIYNNVSTINDLSNIVNNSSLVNLSSIVCRIFSGKKYPLP